MKKLIELLKQQKGKVLVLAHHNADIDATASAIVLAESLGKIGIKASIGVAESVSKAAKKLSEPFDILIDPDCSKFDFIVLVDTSVPEQLSSVKNLRADAVIDHHKRSKLCEGAVCLINENSKSTAQLVYKVVKNLGCEIDENMAKLLCAGIVADTAHLKLADNDVFSDLAKLTKIIQFSEVLDIITTEETLSERIVSIKCAKRIDAYRFGDIIVAFSDIVSHEAIGARLLLKIGSDIGIVIAERKNETRISSRGNKRILEKGINLSEIFIEVGKFLEGNGGGHSLAGSANGKKKKRQVVKNFILKLLSKKLGAWKKLE